MGPLLNGELDRGTTVPCNTTYLPTSGSRQIDDGGKHNLGAQSKSRVGLVPPPQCDPIRASFKEASELSGSGRPPGSERKVKRRSISRFQNLMGPKDVIWQPG
jgi:hypothetical protein